MHATRLVLTAFAVCLGACATAGGGGDDNVDIDADPHAPDAGPGTIDGGGGSTDDPFACPPGVDSPFGAPQPATGFPAVAGVSVSDDLLEIVFTNGSDIFHAKRNTTADDFVSSGVAEIQNALWGSELALSGDGTVMAFAGRMALVDQDRLYRAPTTMVSSKPAWLQLDGPTAPRGVRTVGFAANGELYVLEDNGSGNQLVRLDTGGGVVTRVLQSVQGVTSLQFAVISADEKTLYYRAASGGGLLRAVRTSRDVVFVPDPASDLPVDGGGLTWIPQWVSPQGCGLLVRRLGGGAPELHWLLKPV